MSDAVFLLVVIGYEVTAFLAARRAYWSLDPDRDDPVDKFVMGCCALFFCQFWPVAAPVALVLWKPRKTPEQVEAENQAMKRRIAELERELGIGGRT